MKRTFPKTKEPESEGLSEKQITLAIQYLDPDVKRDTSINVVLFATLVAVLLLVAISFSVHFGIEAIFSHR